jgi:hypothetical protein
MFQEEDYCNTDTFSNAQPTNHLDDFDVIEAFEPCYDSGIAERNAIRLSELTGTPFEVKQISDGVFQAVEVKPDYTEFNTEEFSELSANSTTSNDTRSRLTAEEIADFKAPYEDVYAVTLRATTLSTLTKTPHQVQELPNGLFQAVPAANKIHRAVESALRDFEEDDRHYCKVDLLQHIDDNHLMKRLALSIANATDLPQSTVFLLGLGVFSSVACRRWIVNYQHSGSLPISNYIGAEQPSGTGKTRCLNTYQRPFQEAHSKHIKKCRQKLEVLNCIEKPDDDVKQEIRELTKLAQVPLFVTNTTPEALEKSLIFSEGFFSAVSSEQGLINSLLGKMYGNESKTNNNDLVLNGFNGDFVTSMRVTREGFSGFIAGGITLFAQSGSIETILKESNGTGLSERFLMIAEHDNLGHRDWLKNKSIDKFLTDEYSRICNNFADSVFSNPKPFNELQELNITTDSWQLINQFRNDLEPELKAGGKYSHASLRGAIGKIDMQIMKIAANLHILKYSHLPPSTIDNDTVISAINIMRDMTEAHLMMLQDKGAVGVTAEYSAIISYLSRKSAKGVMKREMVNSLKTTQPFKSITGSKNAAINNAIDEMLEFGLLTLTDGIYSIAK